MNSLVDIARVLVCCGNWHSNHIIPSALRVGEGNRVGPFRVSLGCVMQAMGLATIAASLCVASTEPVDEPGKEMQEDLLSIHPAAYLLVRQARYAQSHCSTCSEDGQRRRGS